jgi:nickel transport protein
VESTFSSGCVPTGGEIRVRAAENTLLMTLEIGAEGKTTFDLSDGASETGLMIEGDVIEGHSDYWMLTPDDIAYGQGTN